MSSEYTYGTWRAIAKAWGLTELAGGGQQLVVKFEILAGPDTGRAITFYSGFSSEKASAFTIKAMRNCGWQGNDAAQLGTMGSLEVDLVIAEDMFNGQARAKVKYVNRPGQADGGLKLTAPLEGEKLQAFARSLQAAAEAVPAIPPVAGGIDF